MPPVSRAALLLVLLTPALAAGAAPPSPSPPPPAVAADRPALAVKTFENPTADRSSTIGTGLTHIFITELEKTALFRIVERDAFATLTDEVDRGDSGYVDPESTVAKGHILGIDYWFMATVTNFGSDEKAVAGGLLVPVIGGLGVNKKSARVRLDFRVVDAASGETILADFGEAAVKRSSIAGAGYAGVIAGGQWFESSEFLESMLGRATLEAVGDAIGKLAAGFPAARAAAGQARREQARSRTGRVLAVSEGSAFIDLGADAGVEPGDTLDVYSVRDVRNAAGEVVYRHEEVVGGITILEVRPDRSMATFAEGLGVAEGCIVRARIAPVAVADTRAPPASATAAGPAPPPARKRTQSLPR